MNSDLINNHFKNIETLEKFQSSDTTTNKSLSENDIELIKLKRISIKTELKKNKNNNKNNLNPIIGNLIYTLSLLKNSYKIIYYPIKYVYLILLSLIVYNIVYNRKRKFESIYYELEDKFFI